MSTSGPPAPPPRPPPVHEAHNPYVGPRAFEIGETLYGRDREVDDLFDLLVARRIVLLYAPSGAGKSSLVQAGLIPRLRAERFADLPIIRVNLEPPAGAPTANRYIASVTAALAPASPGAAASLEACLAERERSLAARSPVLIFDQFEELFTTDPTDLEKKQAFFTQVGAALQNANRWALFVMREEFVGALEPYARFVPTRLAAALRLDLLGIAAAREAIQRPAGSVITDAAADALIEDLRVVRVQQADGSVVSRPGPYIEPSQLQVVCYRLWERPRADPAHITPGDVAAAAAGHGAVDAALAGYYADQVTAVAARFGTSERAIRDWFDRRLITPQGVRALVLREPDEGGAADGRIPNAVIRALVDAHLVRAEERRGVTWFELAHDRLIEPVRQDNRTWKEAHLNALQRGAEAWDRQSRLDGLLLSGAALPEAAKWAEAHPGDVTAIEHEYLNQSRRADELATATLESNYKQLQVDAAQRIAASERAGRRRQTILSIALGVLALLALAAFGYSLLITAEASHQRDVAVQAEADAANQRAAAVGASAEAQAQRDAALKANAEAQAQRDAAQKANAAAQAQTRLALARELAANASLQQGSDPELSTLLALESLGITYTPEADSVAWQAANQWHQRLRLPYDAPLDRALYSPDGKRVLAFGQQTTASGGVANPVVWDAESGKELFRLAGHKLQVNDAAWSPNGQRIATASADNRAIIWDAATGRPLAELGASRVDILRVIWSRDGRRLATADGEGTVRIWNATGGEATYQLAHKGKVLDMAWAPGDRYLATAGEDRLIHIWDPASGRQVRVMSGHSAAVRRVAWNAAGNLIATSSDDGSARIWNLDIQTAVAVLPERGGSITDLAWHPKDNVLATSDADGAVSLWRAPAGGLLREFGARRGPVAAIAFAPDGKRLATIEDDNTARVWDVDTGAEIIELAGHATTVTSAMFSPDGQNLLTSSADHTARIWRVERPQRVNAPLNGTPTALAWSADGRFVAVALGEKVVLWNVGANVAEGDLVHEFPVEAVAFSPDGKQLATGSGTCCDISLGTVTVWNVSDRAEQWSESEHAHIVESVAWSPDGRRVVSASRDETARVWDAANGKPLMQIKSGNPLKAVAWSRDGRIIAGMQANAVRLWDAQNGQLARSLAGGNTGARQVAFSPDSRLILVPADGRAARVYDVATGERRSEVFMDDDVHSVAWDPKGGQIATGGADGTVRLWDAANGVPQRNLLGYRLDVTAIIYSPDGVRLATVNDDGSLRFFLANLDDVIAYARSRVTRQLTCAEKVKFLHAELTCPK